MTHTAVRGMWAKMLGATAEPISPVRLLNRLSVLSEWSPVLVSARVADRFHEIMPHRSGINPWFCPASAPAGFEFVPAQGVGFPNKQKPTGKSQARCARVSAVRQAVYLAPRLEILRSQVRTAPRCEPAHKETLFIGRQLGRPPKNPKAPPKGVYTPHLAAAAGLTLA